MSYDARPDLQMPLDESQVPHSERFDVGGDFAEALRPVNWNLLTADEAYPEWHDLDTWVTWLRKTYGLPPTILPPFWHRHDELIWELSALHLHWRASYDSEAPPSAPCMWHRDFAEARSRLREWVSLCGTRLDRDRPTRQTAWPGEPPTTPGPEREIANRDEDFELFALEDIAARRRPQRRVA